MKLQYKAWLLVASTIGLLTLASVLVSRQSISASFETLERNHALLESERARRLLNQHLAGLSATLMDYAYWTDTVDFITGSQEGYFNENFGTDNMKSLGITSVLVLDALGRPVVGAELTSEPALHPISEAMTQVLRGLAVPVLSDSSSKKVMRTYHRLNGSLYLVSIAAVRSQFEPGTPPKGALAMVRRFDADELTRFSDILMHPVRLSLSEPSIVDASKGQSSIDETRAASMSPILDHEGRTVAALVLDLDRDLHQSGRTLALAAAMQVATAGFVVGTVLLLMLNYLVLRRMRRVHMELAGVIDQGLEGVGTLFAKGEDELADVAKGINQLLTKTRDDAAQQRQAYARQEALQLQLLQSQKTEALGRFTSGIAHDFNNSLAAISGWVSLAKEDLTPGHPSASSLDQAVKSIRYASGLMKQLLSFSRQSTPCVERLQLSELIEEARALVSLGLMGRCTLNVELRTPHDWVMADPTQMKQVIVNLLINACDAMNGKGSISMILESFESDQIESSSIVGLLDHLPSGRYVALSVRDEGPGIPAEHLDRIFEPFFTTKASDKGTGLGLSVVQGIMARHSGDVRVCSTLGEGACFVLLLPAATSKGAPMAGHQLDAPPVARQLLYAEDDPLIREAWSTLLERQGWVVTATCDGEEAWKHFHARQGRWDAVLTDFAMPHLNGLELAQRIAGTDSPPPVVLVTGQVALLDEEQLEAAGFAFILNKPVEKENLLRVLAEVIEPPPWASVRGSTISDGSEETAFANGAETSDGKREQLSAES